MSTLELKQTAEGFEVDRYIFEHESWAQGYVAQRDFRTWLWHHRPKRGAIDWETTREYETHLMHRGLMLNNACTGHPDHLAALLTELRRALEAAGDTVAGTKGLQDALGYWLTMNAAAKHIAEQADAAGIKAEPGEPEKLMAENPEAVDNLVDKGLIEKTG
jgi:hypothetical protein